jgi:hypothetical protein
LEPLEVLDENPDFELEEEELVDFETDGFENDGLENDGFASAIVEKNANSSARRM